MTEPLQANPIEDTPVIPTKKLLSGGEIPVLGFGVYQMPSVEVRECLPQAIELGYRHIDTANAYFNEVAVGEVVNGSGIDREDFFITSKLFPQSYPRSVCMRDIEATLERLGMDYLDLLLLHQPYGEYLEAWDVLQKARSEGKVRAIGISNFNQEKTQQIIDAGAIPDVNQIELNPRWHQHGFKEWLESQGVVLQGWYPLGHGDRSLLEARAAVDFAKAYGKTPAQIILRWHIQEGNVVFPKTGSLEHMRQNLEIFDFSLTDVEMERLSSLDQEPYYRVPEEAPDYVKTLNDYSQQR